MGNHNDTKSLQVYGRMAVRDRYADIKEKLRSESPIIIDGGAHAGNVIEVFLTQYTAPIIYAFEPNPNLINILKKKYISRSNINIYPFALGSETTKSLFNIINAGASSSILNPSDILRRYHGDNANIEKTFEVPVVRLDDVLNDVGIIDLLKLDLQGYELEALKGSEIILRRTKIITTEIEFVPLYEKQPLFADIDEYLRRYDFRLYNLYELWTQQDGQLTAGDAVYLNSRFFPA
jgi:FkbM family methyltransferase